MFLISFCMYIVGFIFMHTMFFVSRVIKTSLLLLLFIIFSFLFIILSLFFSNFLLNCFCRFFYLLTVSSIYIRFLSHELNFYRLAWFSVSWDVKSFCFAYYINISIHKITRILFAFIFISICFTIFFRELYEPDFFLFTYAIALSLRNFWFSNKYFSQLESKLLDLWLLFTYLFSL